MKFLIVICILVGLLIHSSTGTRCVCKCCTTDDCDTSTAEPQSFDLNGFCNGVTCSRAACSIEFKTCPIPTSAGNVDSKCSESSTASVTIQISVITLTAVLIGTFMKWNLY
jgi:hypothetical protein